MKNIKIIYSKLEYTKKILLDKKHDKCTFCKYNIKNYIYKNDKNKELATKYFSSHCKRCIHFKNNREEILYWMQDEFKPLYDWDEGEKNE